MIPSTCIGRPVGGERVLLAGPVGRFPRPAAIVDAGGGKRGLARVAFIWAMVSFKRCRLGAGLEVEGASLTVDVLLARTRSLGFAYQQ